MPKIASINEDAWSPITVLQGRHWNGQGCSVLVTGVVGNHQRSVINSSDSANMSTVIQCCFHSSLLVVFVRKMSFKGHQDMIHKLDKLCYFIIDNEATWLRWKTRGTLNGRPLFLVYKLGIPFPWQGKKFSSPKRSQIRRLWRMKMTSFELLKDLDITSIAISHILFQKWILFSNIKENARLSSILYHAVIPSKRFSTGRASLSCRSVW